MQVIVPETAERVAATAARLVELAGDPSLVQVNTGGNWAAFVVPDDVADAYRASATSSAPKAAAAEDTDTNAPAAPADSKAAAPGTGEDAAEPPATTKSSRQRGGRQSSKGGS